MSEREQKGEIKPSKTHASVAMDGLTTVHLEKGLTTAHIKQQLEQASPQAAAPTANTTAPQPQAGNKSTNQSS